MADTEQPDLEAQPLGESDRSSASTPLPSIFHDFPPLSRSSQSLLVSAINVGIDRDGRADAPYADWKSLLAAFVLDEHGEDTCNLMRWLERRDIISAFRLLPDFRARRDRARQRIRAGGLPSLAEDGWFTRSVRDVIRLAADLRTGSSNFVEPIHILSAMVLPASNPHENDLQQIANNRTELGRLVGVYALDAASAFDRGELMNLNADLGEIIKANQSGVGSMFLNLIATMEAGKLGAPLTYPYVAAHHLLATASPDQHPSLRSFMQRRAGGMKPGSSDLSTWLAKPQSTPAPHGRGLAVLERARRIAARATPRDSLGLPHIAAALFAASDELPPRNTPVRNPESVEVLEELLGALQPTNDTGRIWAELVLGPVRRTPIVRDLGDRDLIDFDRFARPFAALIADKDLRPPLAIGVFGQWGAGKSTFMNLIEKHVSSLARRAAYQSETDFSAGIVQIKFNAWHYSDVNLWASLVDHIFAELDAWISARAGTDAASQLLSRLATPRQLTLDATDSFLQKRREQLHAKQRLETAERELDVKKAAVKPNIVDIADAVSSAFKNELNDAKSSIGEAARRLGLDQLEGKPQELQGAIDSLANQVAHGRGLGQALLFRLGGWKQLLIVLAMLLVIPIGLVVFKQWLTAATSWSWIKDVSTSLVAVSGFLTTATAIILRASAQITPALDQLGAIKKRLDATIEAKTRELAEGDKQSLEARNELAAADAAVQRARIDLNAANEQLAQEYSAFSAETGSQRLRRFIRERASDGTYAQHMGLIATIRKDFVQLAALLKPPADDKSAVSDRLNYEIAMRSRVRQAGWNDEQVLPRSEALSKLDSAPPMPNVASEQLMTREEVGRLLDTTQSARDVATSRIERIVLYVDDLDRCQPKTVMQVLEAIHILMAIDLFVVIVGVDLAWLLASVDRSYVQIAGTGERNSALAFLEKIFQIPFWVPGMTPAVRQKIIEEALPKGTPSLTIDESSMPPHPDVTIVPPLAGGIEGAREGVEAPILPLPNLRSVALQRAEVVGLVNAARIAGQTPRRLKRLARSYLLLRAGLPEMDVALLETNGDAVSAIALLLAAASCKPQQWPLLRQRILASDPAPSLHSLLSDCGIVVPTDLALPSIAACQRWIDEVARFTFVKLEPDVPVQHTL